MKVLFLLLSMFFVFDCQAAPSFLNKRDLKKAPLLSSLSKLEGREQVVNYRWVCGEKAKTNLTARCSESPAEDFKGATGVLELVATTDIGTFDYGLRHAVELRDCREMLRKILKVKRKNLPYCILGDHIGTPTGEEPRSPINSIFFLLKSPLGYVIDMDF